VIEYPCIATEMLPWDGGPLPGNRTLSDFAAIAFASRRAVLGMARAADAILAISPQTLIAAVGDATAAEVRKTLGREPDLVASSSTGESMGQELAKLLPKGALVLAPSGDHTTGNFQAALAEAGMEVVPLLVYRNVAPALSPLEVVGPFIVVLSSPSTAERFFAANPDKRDAATVVVMGPTTAKRVREMGISRVVVPVKPDPDAIADCIRDLVRESDAGSAGE